MKSILLALLAAAILPAFPLTFGVTGLPGMSVGYKINDSGVVAGWTQNAAGDQQAVLFSSGSLDNLTPSAFDANANGINASGTIVGTSFSGGIAHGTIWSGSAVTDLGANSFATGINDAGVVVGGNGHAFVLVNGIYRDLGALPGGSWSSANDMNDSGTVVGDSTIANGSFRGFISDGAGMEALGTFGGRDSHATAINDAGEVIGSASTLNGFQHAFLALGTIMTDLGTLGGGSSSFAYGINESGEIVGYATLPGGDQHAFLYAGGMMIDLNNLIPAGSGWVLTAAYGINASGQISGTGLFDGVTEAFLLNPQTAALEPAGVAAAVPDPSTASLAGIGIALMALFIRLANGQNRHGMARTFAYARPASPRR